MSEPSQIQHLCDPDGTLLRRDAILRGIDDNALKRLCQDKAIVRMRQGIYCDWQVFRAADEGQRHRLLTHAVVRLYGAHVVVSHVSSCLLQGAPEWGLDLTSVHLWHFEGNGRRNARIRHHTGNLYVDDLRKVGDVWVTVPARAVLEVACTDGLEAALVQANHFLQTGQMHMEQLEQTYQRFARWPDSLNHHLLIHLASAKSESVGESRCDFLFHRHGLPRPVKQYVVHEEDGTEFARVDFAWPELKVIVEFDGQEKYHRFRKPGETIEQMVLREKAREDRIRELTGWTVIRIVWADLELPANTARRIRIKFAAGVALAG